jgi:hypothetical protein
MDFQLAFFIWTVSTWAGLFALIPKFKGADCRPPLITRLLADVSESA